MVGASWHRDPQVIHSFRRVRDEAADKADVLCGGGMHRQRSARRRKWTGSINRRRTDGASMQGRGAAAAAAHSTANNEIDRRRAATLPSPLQHTMLQRNANYITPFITPARLPPASNLLLTSMLAFTGRFLCRYITSTVTVRVTACFRYSLRFCIGWWEIVFRLVKHFMLSHNVYLHVTIRKVSAAFCARSTPLHDKQ